MFGVLVSGDLLGIQPDSQSKVISLNPRCVLGFVADRSEMLPRPGEECPKHGSACQFWHYSEIKDQSGLAEARTKLILSFTLAVIVPERCGNANIENYLDFIP